MANELAILDSNVLLRHLLNDHPEHSPAASGLLGRIEKGESRALLTAVGVAEVVWVLTGRNLGWPRKDVAEVLSGLVAIEHLLIPERQLLQAALGIFGAIAVDFVDAYNAALAGTHGGEVYSFDQDFDRLAGVVRVDPRTLARQS